MKEMKTSFASRVRLYRGALIAFVIIVSAVQSQAQSLSARNTSITFNLSGANPGITDWTVNGGANLLNNQWFYYSVGNNPIYTIDNISSPSGPVIGGTSRSPTLSTTYANADISVFTQFTLGSGLLGSPTATLGDTITLSNPTALTQVYHFYQYSFFSPLNQTASFSPGGVGYSFSGSGSGTTISAQVSSVSGGTSVLSDFQTGVYDGTQFGLTNWNSAPTLSNNTGPVSGFQVDFAYEWVVTLAPSGQPGSSLTISELQSVTVPEPTTMALISAGVLAVGLILWRRGDKKLDLKHRLR